MPALVLVVVISFLTSPPLTPEGEKLACSKHLRIAPALGFAWSCDSLTFVGLAAQPESILEPRGPGKVWQSRPLFIAMAAVARSWFTLPFDYFRIHPQIGSIALAGWLGYVVINVMLLVAALAIFQPVLTRISLSSASLGAAASFLAANHVVKTCFWTPHTQIFNIFVPVLAIALTLRVIESPPRSRASELGLLLAIGIGSLAYGSFLTIGVAVAIAAVIRERRSPRIVRTALGFAARLTVVLLPAAGWAAFIRRRTGAFYSRESNEFHEFVWPFKELERGGFPALVRKASEFHDKFLEATLPALALPLLLIAVLAAVALRRRFDVTNFRPESRRLVEASLIVLAVNLPFWAGLGYYGVRLSWNLYPELIVLTLVLAAEMARAGVIRRLIVERVTIVLAAVNFLFWWIRAGPFY